MSLARGLTKRMKRPAADASAPPPLPPSRSHTVKHPTLQIDRTKISSPLALVSTTNMLSYNAPDIATLKRAQSTNSLAHSSGDDSDHSISGRSRASSQGSRDTLTDASSVESSPTSPAPNHLSGYFASANKSLRKSASSGNLQQVREDPIEEPVPAIPQRAISHSKRAHERLAQKRSLQSLPRGSMGSSRSSREQRASLDMFKGVEEEAHPFGRELEQLNEVAEEFGGVVRDAEMEADMCAMRERSLAVFCVADYLAEIKPLYNGRFGIQHTAPPMAWI